VDLKIKAHSLLSENLDNCSVVVDATLGRGRDTLFLAKEISVKKVYAFDVQIQAIEESEHLLLGENCIKKVSLINECHSKVDSFVKEKINAAIFNLGYLPLSDKRVVTNAKTTLEAITKCLKLADEKFCLCVTSYRGHEGGEAEYNEVKDFFYSTFEKYEVFGDENNLKSPELFFYKR